MIREKLHLRYLLTTISVIVLFLFIYWANYHLDNYSKRILTVSGIYIILGVSLNLINGTTGIFSLGHAGFMGVGAYTAALLTMSVAQKQMTFFIVPLISPLNKISIPFLPALLIGGVIASIFGLIIGIPTLRLGGDYLAIATLGFGEIIVVLFNNLMNITNGALGLKGLVPYTNLWWTYGWVVFTVFFIVRLTNSSYGRALKAIRENEVAAQAMGINLFYHKVLSFIIGAFFAGIGGGLLAHLLTTINPVAFSFLLTFNVLIVIVLGGLGSITGAVIAGFLFPIFLEYLRFIEAPMNIMGLHIPGIPGMRMVVFSLLLLIVMIFYPRGLMGRLEFSWDFIIKRFNKS